jgi:hypothetical protein
MMSLPYLNGKEGWDFLAGTTGGGTLAKDHDVAELDRLGRAHLLFRDALERATERHERCSLCHRYQRLGAPILCRSEQGGSTEVPTPRDIVHAALASRRGRGDGKLYARAAPEKVKIKESYSVKQEISKSPTRKRGACAGQIYISVPYDGGQYFTCQAVDDIKWGLAGRQGNGQGTAVIGHLRLVDHAKTDLRRVIGQMRQYHNVGVMPLEVPVAADIDSADELAADHKTCVIAYDYEPDKPEILPVELIAELHDPDSMNMYGVKLLSSDGEMDLADTIDWLRQKVSFRSELVMSITARLAVPLKPGQAPPSPRVKLMSVDWPAITSLRTTELEIMGYSRSGERRTDSHAVRYNPVHRRLEWEDVSMGAGEVPEGSPEMRVYTSSLMQLRIGHPGELFTAETLTMHAEVEIPGYLLSGLEARVFDATGHVDSRPLMPTLTTRVNVDTEFYVADIFAKRDFLPCQQFIFDDVIPDEMRITDISTVLRNAKFKVEHKQHPGNRENPDAPKWLLSAHRLQGPDKLELLIAVEGEKYVLDRQQIMGNNRIKISGSRESGRMRLSVLGTLPRDHYDLTREMNLLQQALRARFRYQQPSRG